MSLNAKIYFFLSTISLREHDILNDMIMICVYTKPTYKVGFYYASSMKQHTMSLHLKTLSQFQANRSLLLLLMKACLSEEFEDTKGVIRIRKSKKDRHLNAQK